MKRKLFLVIFALLPSSLKVMILRWMGHSIGKNVHIGFLVFLDVKRLVLGSNVKIGAMNYFKNLAELTMEDGARIGGKWNWFTASRFNDAGHEGFGRLVMRSNSGITSRHYFDCAETIEIGAGTLVAGFNSVFYTHGVTPDVGNAVKPITIGEKGYIGSHAMFVPGGKTGDCTFVAARSVVTKDFSREAYVLLAGHPAKVVKTYDPSSQHFNREGDFTPRLQRKPVSV